MRAYRWGEDGLLGFSDNRGLVHFAIALWNGKDPILKERLFGLSNPEGNHGEDVKEVYHYTDATPTCSYARALYRYPHAEFPVEALRRMAKEAGRGTPEPELWDTGVLDDGKYFDVNIEYAKAAIEDLLIRITVTNHGPDATLEVLPTIWFRNTWRWTHESTDQPPHLRRSGPGESCVLLEQDHLGKRRLYDETATELLFTDNETNKLALYGQDNASPHTKDAFHRFVVHGDRDAVNPAQEGTKAAFRHVLKLAHGETRVLKLRMIPDERDKPFADFDAVMESRIKDADDFFTAGCEETTRRTLPRPSASRGATRSGLISTTAKSSPCPTTGSTPGTRRGISDFTASRCRSSTPTSPSSSSRCCSASGTCTPTGSCPRTSGRSGTSTRPCTRGRRSASTRSSAG
jgi:hypothetical protein